MAGFRASAGGATARFAAGEAAIVRSLVSQVAELVGGEAALGDPASGDPADRAGPAGDPTGPAGDPTGLADPTGRTDPGLNDPAGLGPPGGGPGGERGGAAAGGAGDQAAADDLAAQLGLTDDSELPGDPILARLLPDAYSDDPEASGEFRRYTELSLRSGKVAAAQTVLATLPAHGGRVRLTEPDAQAWLRALNDVRLSLGVILNVTDDFEDQMAELSADDPRAAYVGVYQWLAALQDSLVDALG